MQVVETAIPAVRLITPKKFGDHRGFFSETYNRKKLVDAGIDVAFVQDNHSLSAAKGTIRGLHYQIPPMAQDKLVRVVRGSLLDVAVDVRRTSPTFGRWVSAVISAKAWNQILVPAGFAHGFVTLEPDTEVIYKVTDYWSPDHERGIRWDDRALGIDWGVNAEEAVLSDKDASWPTLADQPDLFA
jgi:dTDP-4-dehydrorhamnose 3,5-epimerase